MAIEDAVVPNEVEAVALEEMQASKEVMVVEMKEDSIIKYDFTDYGIKDFSTVICSSYHQNVIVLF